MLTELDVDAAVSLEDLEYPFRASAMAIGVVLCAVITAARAGSSG